MTDFYQVTLARCEKISPLDSKVHAGVLCSSEWAVSKKTSSNVHVFD